MQTRMPKVMKVPTGLLLAISSLLLVGLSQLLAHVGRADPAIAIDLVLLPLVVLASLIFLVRDVIRPASRVYALLGLILLLPGIILVCSIKIG